MAYGVCARSTRRAASLPGEGSPHLRGRVIYRVSGGTDFKSASRNPRIRLREASRRCQRSTPTLMLRPVSSAKVAVCAYSFANSGSFATFSCVLPYASQLA